jgi:hypothetical protein
MTDSNLSAVEALLKSTIEHMRVADSPENKKFKEAHKKFEEALKAGESRCKSNEAGRSEAIDVLGQILDVLRRKVQVCWCFGTGNEEEELTVDAINRAITSDQDFFALYDYTDDPKVKRKLSVFSILQVIDRLKNATELIRAYAKVDNTTPILEYFFFSPLLKQINLDLTKAAAKGEYDVENKHYSTLFRYSGTESVHDKIQELLRGVSIALEKVHQEVFTEAHGLIRVVVNTTSTINVLRIIGEFKEFDQRHESMGFVWRMLSLVSLFSGVLPFTRAAVVHVSLKAHLQHLRIRVQEKGKRLRKERLEAYGDMIEQFELAVKDEILLKESMKDPKTFESRFGWRLGFDANAGDILKIILSPNYKAAYSRAKDEKDTSILKRAMYQMCCDGYSIASWYRNVYVKKANEQAFFGNLGLRYFSRSHIRKYANHTMFGCKTDIDLAMKNDDFAKIFRIASLGLSQHNARETCDLGFSQDGVIFAFARISMFHNRKSDEKYGTSSVTDFVKLLVRMSVEHHVCVDSLFNSMKRTSMTVGLPGSGMLGETYSEDVKVVSIVSPGEEDDDDDNVYALGKTSGDFDEAAEEASTVKSHFTWVLCVEVLLAHDCELLCKKLSEFFQQLGFPKQQPAQNETLLYKIIQQMRNLDEVRNRRENSTKPYLIFPQKGLHVMGMLRSPDCSPFEKVEDHPFLKSGASEEDYAVLVAKQIKAVYESSNLDL